MGSYFDKNHSRARATALASWKSEDISKSQLPSREFVNHLRNVLLDVVIKVELSQKRVETVVCRSKVRFTLFKALLPFCSDFCLQSFNLLNSFNNVLQLSRQSFSLEVSGCSNCCLWSQRHGAWWLIQMWMHLWVSLQTSYQILQPRWTEGSRSLNLSTGSIILSTHL